MRDKDEKDGQKAQIDNAPSIKSFIGYKSNRNTIKKAIESRRQMSNDVDTTRDRTSVQVIVRIRPLLPKEIASKAKISLQSDRVSIRIPNSSSFTLPSQTSLPAKTFTFDRVFSPQTSQTEFYEQSLKPLMDTFMQGFNVTVVAYGQTGSGKTFTMGNQANRSTDVTYSIPQDARSSDPHDGLIPRFLKEYFDRMQKEKEERRHEFQVSVSYLEIYGEEIHDLLDPRMAISDNLIHGNAALEKLQLREGKSGVYVRGLSEVRVQTCEEAMEQMRAGCLRRITGSTEMNDHSSRSHAVYTVKMVRYVRRSRPQESTSTGSWSSKSTQGDAGEFDADNNSFEDASNDLREDILNATIISKLTFVDLAGSERLKRTMAEGTRMKEGIQINSGLLALGNVINALGVERRRPQSSAFIPYRASKLTRLLQDALGGNSRTLFIACVSSTLQSLNESHSTLQYANRAKNIQNKAVKNIDTRTVQMMALRAMNALLRQELLKARLLLPNRRENIALNPTQMEAYLEKVMQEPVIIELLQKMEELAVSAYDSCVPFSALTGQCDTLWNRAFGSETAMSCGNYESSQIASNGTNGTSSTLSSISSRFLLAGDDCFSDISCSCSQSGGCTCGESSATVSTNGDTACVGESLGEMQHESLSSLDVVNGQANCQNWNAFLAVLDVVSITLEIRQMRQNATTANENLQEKIQRQTVRVDRCKRIAEAAFCALEKRKDDQNGVEIAKKRVELSQEHSLQLEKQLEALHDQSRKQSERRQEEIRRKCVQLEIIRRSIKQRNHETETLQPLDILIRSEEVRRRSGVDKLCQVAEKVQIDDNEMAILNSEDSDQIARCSMAFCDPQCITKRLQNDSQKEDVQTSDIVMREFNNVFQEMIEMEVLEATYALQVRTRTRLIEELSDSETEADQKLKGQQLAKCEIHIRRLSDLLGECATLEKSQLRDRFNATLHSIPNLESARHIIRKMAEEVHVHRRLWSRNCLEMMDNSVEQQTNEISEKLITAKEHEERMERLMEQHEEELIDTLGLQSRLDLDAETKNTNRDDTHARQIQSLSSKLNAMNEKLKTAEAERDAATHKLAQIDEELSLERKEVQILKTRMEEAKDEKELSDLLEKCRSMWRELGRSVSDENAKFQDINSILRQRCNEELAELESTRNRLIERVMSLYDQVKMVERLLQVEKDAQVVSFHELSTVTSDSLLHQEQYLSARYKTLGDTIRDRLQVKIRIWQDIGEHVEVLQIRQVADFRYIPTDRAVMHTEQLDALTLIVYGCGETDTHPALSVWKEFVADPMRLDRILSSLQGDGNSLFSETVLVHDTTFCEALCEEKSARLLHLGEFFREIEQLVKQMEFSSEELHRFGIHVAGDRMDDVRMQNALLMITGKGGNVDLSSETFDFMERIKDELDKVFSGRRDAMRCFIMTLGLIAKLRNDMFRAHCPDLEDLLRQHTWELDACALELNDEKSSLCAPATFRLGKKCLLAEYARWQSAARAFLSTMNAEMSSFGIESDADRIRFLLGRESKDTLSDRLVLDRFYDPNSDVEQELSNGQDTLILRIDPIFSEMGVVFAPSYAKESIRQLQKLACDLKVVERLVQGARHQLSSLHKIMELYATIERYDQEIAKFNEEASKKERLFGDSKCLKREFLYRARIAREYPVLLEAFKKALWRWGIREQGKDMRHTEPEFDSSILGAEFLQFLTNIVNTKTALLHLDLGMMNVQEGKRRPPTSTTQKIPRSGSMQALVSSPNGHGKRRLRTASTSSSVPRRNHSIR
uniref:Kinesinlike protein putative n=1 Tax=Albugo laibachii Nc14 TaxID=890382 RepID=F0W936_9STRA|nr:kinesinlike protein putative [Albugo laibachii Nc14]|eukprot:CCA17648.1 kinesinlike protein putative [Albugo laibachii Nc14]